MLGNILRRAFKDITLVRLNDAQSPSKNKVKSDQTSDDTKPLVDEIKPSQPEFDEDWGFENVSMADVAIAKSAAKFSVKKSPKATEKPAPTNSRASTQPRVASSTKPTRVAPLSTKTKRPTSASLENDKPLVGEAARASTRPATPRRISLPSLSVHPASSRAPLSRPAVRGAAQMASSTPAPRTNMSSMKIVPRPTNTSKLREASATSPASKPQTPIKRMSLSSRSTPTSKTPTKRTPTKPQTAVTLLASSSTPTSKTPTLRTPTKQGAPTARTPLASRSTPTSKTIIRNTPIKPPTPTARTLLASNSTPTSVTPTKRTPTKPTSASASSKELASTPFSKRQARLRVKSTEKKPAPADVLH